MRGAVGEVLAQAFAELAVAQPTDPIQFVGGWLNKYVEAARAAESVKEELEVLEVDRTEFQKEREAERKIAAEKAAVIKAKIDAVTAFTAELDARYVDAPAEGLAGEPLGPFDQVYSDLCERAYNLTGARGIYVAKVENKDGGGEGDGPGAILHYTHVAKSTSTITTNIVGVEHGNHDFMKEVVFPQEEGKNVVWKAFEPVVEETEGEEGGEEKPPQYKPYHVKDVMDAEGMQFVAVTRLGEMLVLPIVYPDVLSQASIEGATAFLGERDAAVAAAKEEYDAAVQAAADAPAPEEGEEPVEPEPLPKSPEEVHAEMKEPPLPGADVQVRIALCIETLGTEQQLTPSEVEVLAAATTAVTNCRARYDTYSVWQQAQGVYVASLGEAAEAAEAAKAEFVEARDKVVADLEAAKAEPAEGEGDADVDQLQLAAAQASFDAYKVFFEAQEEAVTAAAMAVYPATAVKAWAAGALLAGVDHNSVLVQGTGSPDWEKIKVQLPALIAAIKGCTPAGARTGLHERHKLVFYKAIIDSLDVESFADRAGVQPLLLFVKAALALREADIKVRLVPDAAPDDDFPPVEEAPAEEA